MVVICGVSIILRRKLKNSQKKILREKLKGKCDHLCYFLVHRTLISLLFPPSSILLHLLVPQFLKINSWEEGDNNLSDAWPPSCVHFHAKRDRCTISLAGNEPLSLRTQVVNLMA